MPPQRPAGTGANNHLWKSDQEWILLFDNLMKYPNGKRTLNTTQTAAPGHQYYPSVQPAASQTVPSANAAAPSSSSQYRSNVNPSPIPLPPTITPITRPREMPLAGNGMSSAAGAAAANNVGGVEADNFIESFLDVPRITNVVSGSAVEQELSKISQTLSDTSIDWSKRIDALKRLRSVVLAGGDIYKEFYTSLRFVDVALQISVKDLRSQVVRETCVTLAFLAQQLGHKFERTAEVLLPALISLIPNSAKIISTSGIVAIQFFLQNTHSQKLVPIIVNHLQTSRSKDVRRYCCEFVKHILFVWPKESLEKHTLLLQEAIKRGISDADPEARSLSRQAYWHFTNVFPGQADVLVSQLDPSNKKMLEDGRQATVFAHQTPAARATPSRDSSRPPSRIRRPSETEADSSSRPPSRLRRPSENETDFQGGGMPSRASSAIDTEAARRARAKIAVPVNTPKQEPKSSVLSGLATPLRSRKSFGTTSTPISSKSSSSARAYVSRSAVTSRDNSPDKQRTFSGLPVRKSSTGVKPSGGDASGRRSQMDSRGYQSDDDGDTSQFGSQTSLSGARFAYNVPEIIALLSGPNWSSRKEGLMGLQKYLRTGTLYPADVDNVRLLLTRMMSDPTTKVFSLFLDTLYDFLNVHKLDLGSWIYVLLTKLFGKMSVDLLPSIQVKLDRCFELTRNSFAAENQFQQLLKFVNDSLQTPNLKVKAAFLNYLIGLIKNNMAPNDFKNTSAVRIGVTKIVNWSLDAKTTELRKLSQNVLAALHELNAGEFTSMLALMDEFLRDTALKVISGPQRRESVEAGKGQRGFLSSRQNSSSNLSAVPKGAASPQSSNDENINPEDYYACLRQTTAAIEKFSLYSNLDYSSGEEGPRRNPDSEDSGFSRTSLNISAAIDSEQSSQNGDVFFSEKVAKLCHQINDLQKTYALEAVHQLKEQLSEANLLKWSAADGMAVVQALENALIHNDPDVSKAAFLLGAELIHHGVPFSENILPLVLDLQHDENRSVARTAEETMTRITQAIPFPVIMEILGTLFLSNESPRNIRAAALSMQLIQRSDRSMLLPNLQKMLPPIVQGFNVSPEPNVRKECMLSIVDIQLKTGPDSVGPFIKDLTVNKIKLLNLYLQRK